MSTYAERHLIYRMGNADIRRFPYPHFYIEDVFPKEFYAQMRAHFPQADAMPALKDVRPVGQSYPEERLCIALAPTGIARLPAGQAAFWTETAQWLLGQAFLEVLLWKFESFLAERFKTFAGVGFQNEALLVDDHTRYFLGPHSDSPKKVLTLLFYLPADRSQEHLGTSIYMPCDPAFRCNGGPHYPFGQFERMYTAPFRPNSLFGFVKTSNSFHGVEPLREDEASRRQLMLYDVYVPVEFGLGTHASASAP